MNELVGKRVLLDVTEYAADGSLRLRVNAVGRIVKIGKQTTVVRSERTGELITVKTVHDNLFEIPAEEHYSLDTGEVVSRLDLIGRWIHYDRISGRSTPIWG